MVKKYGQLKEGEVYTLIVTEVNFSKECELVIWAQPELDETLNYIFEKVQDAIPKRQQLLEVKIGGLCLCQYTEDEDWYRACIEAKVAPGRWKVCFIDFGNHQIVDESLLYQMPPHLCELPGLAMKLALDGSIQPLASAGLLSSTVVKAILDVFLNNKVDVLVTKVCAEGYYEIHCNAINTLLVQRKLVSLESSYPYSAFPIDGEFQAYVSEVTLDGNLYLQELKSSQNLDQLMDAMRGYYAIPNNAVPVAAKDLVPGGVVAAVFSRDSAYYRAQIASVDDDLCTVHFIDYGNSEKQAKSSIFVLPSQFCNLNYQAVSCKLHDVYISAENYSEKLRSILFDQLSEQLVDIKIHGHSVFRKLCISGFYHAEKLGSLLVLSGLAKLKHFQPQPTYRYMDIEEGSVGKAIISHVESNGVFYVTMLSEASKIDQLSNNLSAYCPIAQPLETVENLMPCCALDHKDSNWYRAIIKSCNKETATVYHVDFGSSTNCDILSLRAIPQEFLNLHCQAVKCSILRRMTAAEAEILNSLVGEIVEVKFLKQKEMNSYTVKLFHNGKALFLPSANEDGRSQSTVNLDHCDPNVFDGSRSDSKSLQNGNTVSSAVDESYVQVALCFIEDPDCMWFQQLSNDQKLFKLIADMNLFYGTLPSNVLCFQEIQFDNFCCVRILEAGKENWYRGRILCLYSDVVEVKLIDFGNEVKVKQHDIRILTSQFLQLEAQALKCKLFNIKPSSEQWSVASIQSLFNLTKAAKKISARFIEKQSSAYAIDLVVDIDDRSFSVNERLVLLNHAVWLKVPMHEKAKISQSDVSDQSSIACKNSLSNNFHKLFYHSLGLSLVGAKLKVIAAEVESPDDFFLKVNNANHYELYAKLTQEVNAACAYPSSDLRQGELYIGMPCCVFYDKLKRWCRGALLNLHDADKLEVCLVDEGCIIHCALQNVRSISAQFVLSAPPAAMRCTLRGIIASTNSNWTLAALNITQNFFHTNYRNLSCTIHGCIRDELGTYLLCDVRSPLGSLADELVDSNLAVRLERIGQVSPPLKLQSFIYSNFQVVKGKETLFHITHVENANLFYSQLATQIPGMNSMLHDLQQQCMKNSGLIVTPDILAQECVCFAKCNGKQWNRAHFISSEPNGFVKVMFVDRGNTEIVHLSDVQRFANERFFELPIQALPCSLEDVDVSSANPKEAQLVFALMQKLLLNKQLRGVVAASTSGKIHLDIFEEGKRVNSIIMNEAMPKRSIPSYTPVPVDKSLHLSEAGGKREIVEPSFRNVSKNFIETTCNDEIILEPPLNWSGEQPVYISHVLSSSEVFLQSIQELAKLDALMFEVNNDLKLEQFTTPPKQKTFCFARYKADNQLYRAFVEKIVTEDASQYFLVTFVDYGNTSKVNLSDLRKIPKIFTSLPQVAISCKVSLLPTKLTSNELFTKLKELSVSENVSISASLKVSQGTDLCTASLKIKPDEQGSVSLYTYVSGCGNLVSNGDPVGQSVNASPCGIPNYVTMKNVLDQTNRQIYVSHVENPGHLYCQFSEFCDDLDTLMDSIEVYYNVERKEDKIDSIQCLAVDSPCIAKYQPDNKWYRAKVEKLDGDSKVKVRFVDYGNFEVLSIGDIRKTKVGFCVLPVQAICCFVAHVNNNSSAWSTEEIDAFDERVASFKLRATFSKLVDEKNDIFEVMLRLPDGTLLNNEYMKSTTEIEVNATKEQSNTDSMDDGVSKNLNDDSSAGEAAVVSDANTFVPLLNEVEIKEGMIKECYVSHAKTPTNFYVQLAESESAIDSLSIFAAEDSQTDDEQFKLCDAAVGSYCVVQNPEDAEWYRGKVTEAGDRPTVFFVDYGDTVTVDWSNIRSMSKQTTTLPIQAIPCYLANLPEFPEHSVDEVVEVFLNTVMDNLVTIKFVTNRPSSKWEVELQVANTDVAKTLSEFATMKSAVTTQSPDPKLLKVPASEKLEEPAVFTESMLQDFVGHSKTTDIEPGTILIGEVVCAVSLDSFYVKLDRASWSYLTHLKEAQQSLEIVDRKPIGLKLFLAKRSEEENWKHAVAVKKHNGDSIALFIDDGVVVECDAIHDIQKPEIPTNDSASIFHCKLSDVKSSDQQQMMKYFVDNVLRKKVCITFLEFDNNSSAWVVDLAFINNEIAFALQTKTSVPNEHNLEEKIQQPIASSTPALPMIVVTGAEGLKQTHMTDFAPNQEVCTNSGQLTTCATPEDCVRYCQFVCNEVKKLLLQSAPADDIMRVVDGVVSSLDLQSKQLFEQSHVGDGDAALSFLDDHKRASSAVPYTTSPCKRRKLEKFPKASTGTPVIFSSIPEDEVTENQDEKYVLPHVNIDADGCCHTTTEEELLLSAKEEDQVPLESRVPLGDLHMTLPTPADSQSCTVSEKYINLPEILSTVSNLSDSVFTENEEESPAVLPQDASEAKPRTFQIYHSSTRTPASDENRVPQFVIQSEKEPHGKENELPDEQGTPPVGRNGDECPAEDEPVDKEKGSACAEYSNNTYVVGEEDAAQEDEVAAQEDEDAAQEDEDAAQEDEDAAQEDEDAAQEDEDAAQEDDDVAQQDEDAAQEEENTAQEDDDAAREEDDAAQEEDDATQEEEYTAQEDDDAAQEEKNAAQEEDVAQEEEDVTQEKENIAQEEEDAAQKDEDAAQEKEDAAQKNEDAAQEDENAAQEDEDAAQKDKDTAQKEEDDAHDEDYRVVDKRIQMENEKVDVVSEEILTTACELETLEIRSTFSPESLPAGDFTMSHDQIIGGLNDTRKDHEEFGASEERISSFVGVDDECGESGTYEEKNDVDAQEPDSSERKTGLADDDKKESSQEINKSVVEEEDEAVASQ